MKQVWHIYVTNITSIQSAQSADKDRWPDTNLNVYSTGAMK